MRMAVEWTSARAVAVFGAEAYADRPCPELLARLEHGLELWRQQQAETIVCLGGISPGGVREDLVMQDWLVRNGAPRSAVITMPGCRCTRSSVAALTAMNPEWQLTLVSAPYHLRRIRMECRRRGLHPCLSAPESTPVTLSPRALRRQRLREAAAIFRDIILSAAVNPSRRTCASDPRGAEQEMKAEPTPSL